MAVWRVSPADKKSIEEHEFWSKDGFQITRITGWRTGSWLVTTSDDSKPQFERNEDGAIDMNCCSGNNIEECEMEETWDGWYGDIVWPDDFDDEEEQERLTELWDEESYDGWEGEGWIQTDTEMWVWGDLEVEKVEE